MTQPDKTALTKLLENYEEQLASLRQQQEMLGNQTPKYVLSDIEGLENRIADLRRQLQEMGEAAPTRGISTGGGAYIGGGVTTGGGDFVGRDKRTYGDLVRGDKIGGDKIAGDAITTGNISGGTGIAIGRNAQSNVYAQPAITGDDLNRIFAPVMDAASSAPADQRNQALRCAERLKNEAARGVDADDGRLGDLIEELVERAPNSVTAIVDAFGAPLLTPAVGPVTQRVLRWIQRLS